MILQLLNEEYINENAKVDKEYINNYSDIDREVFNKIVLLDPKTGVQGNDIINIGFIAKALLLPRYKAGETDFIDNAELPDLLKEYASNLGKYAKPNQFKSVAEFISYMKDPSSVEIQNNTEEKKDPVTKIYDTYYKKDIPEREVFDKIIKLDPQTTDNSIGEVAKNLFLPKFISDDSWFTQLDHADIKRAAKDYYSVKSTLPSEKQNLSSYSTVPEFISFIEEGPESNLVSDLKNNNNVDPRTGKKVKDSFRLVGSSRNYDILEPKTHAANRAISGGERGNDWCTGWSSDTHWLNYAGNNNENGRIFCFIDKNHSRDRSYNWQVRVTPRGRIEGHRTFVDGNDYTSGYPGETLEDQFSNFLRAKPEILMAIKDKEPFNTANYVQRVVAELKYADEPFTLSEETRLQFIKDKQGILSIVKEVIIENIESIPSTAFANCVTLQKVTIKDNVKKIGSQAFKNCPELSSLTLGNNLEVIGAEAFANCGKLSGSIRVPDSVTDIKALAFDGTHCNLKVPETRTNPLYFSRQDEKWVKDHVKSIKG